MFSCRIGNTAKWMKRDKSHGGVGLWLLSSLGHLLVRLGLIIDDAWLIIAAAGYLGGFWRCTCSHYFSHSTMFACFWLQSNFVLDWHFFAMVPLLMFQWGIKLSHISGSWTTSSPREAQTWLLFLFCTLLWVALLQPKAVRCSKSGDSQLGHLILSCCVF